MLNRFWMALALVAGIAGATYLTRAYLIYFRVPPYEQFKGRVDVYRRWQEVHYVFRGRNPYDVAFASTDMLRGFAPAGQSTVRRNSGVYPDLGVPEGVVYPPWAFPVESIFYWPNRLAVLYYYGGWMLLGIMGIAVWAGREMQSAGGTIAAVLAAGLSTLACAAWSGAVVVGNNPPITVGLLVLCFVALGLKKEIAAGVFLGMATLKPTVAGPFVLPLLFNHRWKALIVIGAFAALNSVITWKLTATNPLEMLRQMAAAGRLFADQGFGFSQYLIHAGVGNSFANASSALLFLFLGGMGMFALRGKPLRGQFALAALTARLWSYHLYYDDAILAFTLVYFACRLQSNPSLISASLFLLLLISLWLPGRLGEKILVFQIFELSVWILSGVGVLWLETPPLDAYQRTGISSRII